MKRLISTLLLSSILISSVAMSGCNNNTSKSTESQVTTEISDTISSNSSMTAQKGKLPKTFNIPLKEIYIDVPNWQEIEAGFTELLFVDNVI